MRRHHPFRALARFSPMVAVLALAVVVVAAPARAAGQDFDRWYTLEMAGQRAGWSHTAQVTRGDLVTTLSKMSLKVGRGDVAIEVLFESEFVETKEGKPVSAWSVQKSGAAPTRTEYTFNEDGIGVVTIQNGRRSETTEALPEGIWLPPGAAASYTRQRLAAGATQIVVRTIDPLLGAKAVTITRDVEERAPLDVLGKSVTAIRCRVSQSVAPDVPTTEWIDEDGVTLKSDSRFGAIRLVLTAAKKADALTGHDAPEIMFSTFVKPTGRLDDARACVRATYLLALGDGKLPDLPATGAQRVERLDKARARVIVDATRPGAATAEEIANGAYLASSATIEAGDPAVKALHERAVKRLSENAAGSAAERAEALRRFVYGHIDRKNLATGFATASEVARTRAGDCTEHAVLLAALLRADGIPARVASGLVYVDGIDDAGPVFGYHMWTQAMLEVEGARRWVDLDATLSDKRPFDATHIALTVSGLGDGETFEAMLPLAGIIGNLSITIEKAE